MNGLLRRLRLREIGPHWLSAMIAALVLGSGTIAVGLAIPSADGRIFGCYDAKDGALRLVSEGDACAKDELAIFWNQMGPPGPKGDTGEPGPKGDTGPAGSGVASLDSLNALPCTGQTGAAGTTRLVVADGNVSIFCDVPRPTGPTVRPVFSSVAVTGSIVTVAFSEPVCRETPFNPPDWTVISNGFAAPSVFVVGDDLPMCDAGGDSAIAAAHLLLAVEVPNGSFVGVTLNAGFGFGPLTDRDGNPVIAPQTRTATASPPETIRPTLVSATAILGSQTLTLTFSEPVWCNFSVQFNASDFTITDDDPATTDLMVTGMGSNPCATTMLTADVSFSVTTDGSFQTGRRYTVTLTPEVNDIQDLAGNDLQQTDRLIVVN